MTIELQSYWRNAAGTILSETDLVKLLAENIKGIYIFDGKTSCGKSRILRKLKQQRTIRVFSTEQITEILLALCVEDISISITERLASALSTLDCIAIEDIDYLYGKANTLALVMEAIQRLAATQLIILNGNDLEQTIPELSQLPDVHYFRVCL